MKKLAIVISLVLLLNVFTLSVFANPNMKGDIGTIKIPDMASPMVDGDITAEEGWSEGVYAHRDLMATFGNTNEINQSFWLYYAYDQSGLYYAADIKDNSFTYSTGPDDIDNVKNDFNIKNENVYGYNGDIFTFVIDPLGVFLDTGFTANDDYTAWYSVGIFEDSGCHIYRGHSNPAELTADVKVSGKATAEGWLFEAFIPWDYICEDTESMSYGEIKVTEEQLYAGGAAHRVMAIYMDRFYDDEAEQVATFQRFSTCAYKLYDGLSGYLSSGMPIKCYGITLELGEAPANQETSTPTSDTNANVDGETTHSTVTNSTAEKGSVSSTASAKATTKKQNATATTGGASAQTLDIGIAVAIGAVAVSAVGLVCMKKRK